MSRLIEPPNSCPRDARNRDAAADEAGDRAFHVGGAAADTGRRPVRGGEGVGRPGGEIARRHHVGMAGEAEIAPGLAEPRIEVQHLVGAGLGEFDGLAGKAQPFERARQKRDRARILGRDAREADQLRREMHGIDGDHGFSGHQSRSNSLIEVLARVRASTRLTMTRRRGSGLVAVGGWPAGCPAPPPNRPARGP